MARSPSHAAYTVLFQQMLDEFRLDPSRPFVIPCTDQKHANGMRLEWYGFKKSYIKHPANFLNYYKDIEAIGCRIIGDDKGWRLELTHKDNDTVAATLQAALEAHRAARLGPQAAPTPEVPESPADARDEAPSGDDNGYVFKPMTAYQPNGNDELSNNAREEDQRELV